MMPRIHIHVHDSGTPEGARKAARTRKAHGVSATAEEAIEHVKNTTRSPFTGRVTNKPGAGKTISKEELARYLTLKKQSDSGTPEGARKAAQTRKAGGGGSRHAPGRPDIVTRQNPRLVQHHRSEAAKHERTAGRAQTTFQQANHKNAAGAHTLASNFVGHQNYREHAAAAKAATRKANYSLHY